MSTNGYRLSIYSMLCNSSATTARHSWCPSLPGIRTFLTCRLHGWARTAVGIATALHRSGWLIAKSELDLQFYGEGSELYVSVEYAADLFEPATIERLLRHHAAYTRAVGDDSRAVSDALLDHDPTEQHKMLTEWNSTDRSLEESFDRLLEEMGP